MRHESTLCGAAWKLAKQERKYDFTYKIASIDDGYDSDYTTTGYDGGDNRYLFIFFFARTEEKKYGKID